MRADTIPARLMKQAQLRPTEPAYFVKAAGRWRSTDWRAYVSEVRRAGKALIALGLKPGDKVAMLGFNRPEWVIFDLAAMSVGGVGAGIYTTCSAEEVKYIVNHAEARVVLLEDEAQWRKIAAHRDALPGLEHVVMMKGATAIDDPLVLSWSELEARAEEVSDDDLDARLDALDPESLATLIYTSGTTGPPKGVMLSHRNLAWTANVTSGMVDLRSTDLGLSYLPLSHIAEQMMTIHGPTTSGSTIYYAESIDKVADNIREVEPSVLFGVPRIWEKYYAGVSAKLAQATGAKKTLVDWARSVATRVNEQRNAGRSPGLALSAQYRLVDYLVLSKVKKALGLANARICVSGAAPIAVEILEFFASIDVIISEVYGQSEDCGPTTFNQPGKIRLGTVGQPIPGVEVEIADDGEILVKGPNVFMGYYKDEEATAATLVDGWLHSGDLGRFDADGFLHITGRKKDLIITAGGKNIAPKNIEGALKNSELISEAVVIGDRRKFLSALVTLDEDAVKEFIASRGLPNGPVDEIPELRDAVQKVVDEVNGRLAKVETIKKFTILRDNFSIERGELTPTLKVKRNVVNDMYAEAIDAMYTD